MTPTSAAAAPCPNAGLYQYTTRVDQTKDGAQTGNVVIGKHYIAIDTAAQPPSPVDTDGDGVPDYVENWHGDGSYSLHTDTETDWQNDYTDATNTDSLNALYDDVDLDGDGMVGRVEEALSKDPLTPDNPLALLPVPSLGPNQAAFVVPVNFDSLAAAGNVNLSLRVDGKAASLLRCERDTGGGCLLIWDTTYDWSGNHCLQAELFLNGQGTPRSYGASNGLGGDHGPTALPIPRNTKQTGAGRRPVGKLERRESLRPHFPGSDSTILARFSNHLAIALLGGGEPVLQNALAARTKHGPVLRRGEERAPGFQS